MSDYVVAIPTHRRSKLIIRHALGQLWESDVSSEKIHLFLSDDEDVEEYRNTGALDGVNVVVCKDVDTASEKGNYIHHHFPKGTKVFAMEDDVRLIHGVAGTNQKGEPPSLDAFISQSFSTAGDCVWGVAPHDNAFFFDKKPTKTLKLVVAHAYGFTSSQDPSLQITQVAKGDYERTLLYWIRDGAVYRMPNMGVKAAKSYSLSGGMQANHSHAERAALEEDAVAYLTKRYEHLCARKVKKSSPFPEIRFKKPPQDVFDWAEIQSFYDKKNGFPCTRRNFSW